MKPRYRALAVLSVMAALAVVTSTILVNIWWFSELGQVSVYWRMLSVQLVLGGATGVFVTLVLLANAWPGMRRRPDAAPRRTAVVVGCILSGAVTGWRAKAHWLLLVLWQHRQRFGVLDPVHHRDIGSFVFTLPLLEWLLQQLIIVGLSSLLLTAIVYHRAGGLRLRPLHATPAARAHLSGIGSLLLVTLAAKAYLATFTIELHQPGATDKQPFAGAHYVDVRATLPGLQVLTVLLLAGAVALLVSGLARPRYPRGLRRVAVSVPVLLVTATLLAQSLIPALVQRFAVNPNPFAAERSYLAYSIAATRAAFELSSVEIHNEEVGAGNAIKMRPTTVSALQKVQLWDTPVIAGQMRQLASTIPYFRPANPSLELAPGPRLEVLAERELDLGAVPRTGSGWSNRRLAYTHGFGAFQFSATTIGAQGGPTAAATPSPLSQPRIYFGRQLPGAPSWVVANSRRPEVDPGGASSHYRGRGGIQLSSWLRRAAFALQLHDLALLVSSAITPTSRLILHRDVLDRLQTLAPFMTWDTHPIPVIADGRLFFLAAGYTTSNYYPYAQRVALGASTTSYARPAVTAFVDAYSGQVRIYAADTTDPLLRAWRAAFPTLFIPWSDMPLALRAQLRYPPELFDAQAALYQQFHMTNPAVFASQADAWGPPTSLSGPIQTVGDIRFGQGEDNLRYSLRPAYRFAEPPGRPSAHLLRSVLYCPQGAENLAATLDGWIGRDGHPHLASRRITGEHVTLGPAQISRLVLLSPQVSSVLDIRNREVRDLGRSSLDSIALGNPHLVFLEPGQVQVQAVYDIASGGGIVRMRGVTIYANGHSAIGTTLNVAARRALIPPAAISAALSILAAHSHGPR